LTTIFRNEANGVLEQDKLVDLFRNRAELKKEFAALRDEKYKLQDRVKRIAGETARVEQKLDHVENLLLDPDWVLNIAAFYQLRQLARSCAEKLQRFAEQLKQHREKQQHSEVLAVWSRQRREKTAVAERNLGEHRMAMQLLEDQLESERHRLTGMGTIMKWFGRRAVAREIQNIGERIDAGQLQEEKMLKELQSIENMESPSQRSLEVGTKRSINIKILCFAQQLYLQFDDEKLLHLAREASEKGVGTVKYGSNQVCGQILAALERHRRDDQFSVADADMLKKRLMLISQCAEYHGAEDAVPVPASVAKVFAFDAAGEVTETEADILGDNYFSIAKVLSR
jgi:hypothetical protein